MKWSMSSWVSCWYAIVGKSFDTLIIQYSDSRDVDQRTCVCQLYMSLICRPHGYDRAAFRSPGPPSRLKSWLKLAEACRGEDALHLQLHFDTEPFRHHCFLTRGEYPEILSRSRAFVLFTGGVSSRKEWLGYSITAQQPLSNWTLLGLDAGGFAIASGTSGYHE